MTPYKIQILQEDEDRLYWNDFYLDLDQICGFYVVQEPDLIEEQWYNVIVVYVNGENYTLKPEKHLENYLLKRFVKVCVKV